MRSSIAMSGIARSKIYSSTQQHVGCKTSGAPFMRSFIAHEWDTANQNLLLNSARKWVPHSSQFYRA
jgi:hypothetical protein